MRRRRRRSYAPSQSAKARRRYGTPRAPILDWNDAPAALKRGFDDGALLAAWNASFDSAIWNYATLGFPFLEPERVIDPMIQAGVSNLPTDLEGASRTARWRAASRRTARS